MGRRRPQFTYVGNPHLLAAPAPTFALDAAIIALGPLSYWKLRGNDADTLKDFGSLGHDLTSFFMSLDVSAGGDGTNYPMRNGALSTANYFEAADDIAYEPQNASGLTVFYLAKGASGGSSSRQTVHKLDQAGNGSWRHNYTDGIASGYFARTITSGGGTARTRTDTGTLAINTWHKLITRFSGTASAFPAIRVNGSNITGSTGGSGNGNSNSTQTVKLYGHGGSTGVFDGTLAHVAIFAGQLSDADCASIEAAATADGW